MNLFEKNWPPVCSSHRELVAHSQKFKVKVIAIGQGQGNLKEKYSDSNSSNDFAQN